MQTMNFSETAENFLADASQQEEIAAMMAEENAQDAMRFVPENMITARARVASQFAHARSTFSN